MLQLAAAAHARLLAKGCTHLVCYPMTQRLACSTTGPASQRTHCMDKSPLQAVSEDAPIVKLWGEDALLNWPGAM